MEQRGKKYGKRKVTRVMKLLGLIHTRRIPNGITKVTTEIEDKENLIKQDFTALQRRENLRGAILHSDRGSQYTSYEFRQKLMVSGIAQSLSGVAHCYDNSRMESFFATLKKELIYQLPVYKMKKDGLAACSCNLIFGSML